MNHSMRGRINGYWAIRLINYKVVKEKPLL